MLNKPGLRFHDFLFPLLAAAALLFTALGKTPFRRAEIYFADAARAMVERSDWVVPYFRGFPFFDKPALTYWLMAASFKIFGFSEAAARVAPAIAALAVIAATIWLSWLLWEDRPSAVASGWILLSTLAFMMFGRTAMSDMLLTLFSVLAVALGVLCYRAQRPPLFQLIALGAVLGLGFMSKGPIALIIPGFGLLCLIWERRRQFPSLPLAALAGCFLAFVLIAFGWFVVVYARLGLEPLKYFFVHENLQRFAGSAYNAGRPFWFYLVTYLGQGAPWSLFFPFAAFLFLRRQPDSSARMLMLWMLLVVVLLTTSRGKVDYYIVPLYPVSAILIARYLRISNWSKTERVFASIVMAVVGIALVLVPLLVLRLPAEWRPHGIVLIISCAALAVRGGGLIVSAFKPSPSTVLNDLTITLCIAFAVANLFLLPSFYAAEPNSRLLAAASKALVMQPNAKIASREDPTQVHRDLLFYSRIVVENSEDLASLASSGQPYLLLAGSDDARALKTLPGVHEVGSYPYLSSKVFTLRGLRSQSPPDEVVLLANFDF
jgi:4-amino-4-deoxy-L-arabinose transferase-like glycosyltransferase